MTTNDDAVHTTMSLLHDLFDSYHPRNFVVRLWDSAVWEAEEGQPARFTLVLQHPGALRKMLLPPGELTLGEAYIYNDFDIEGDIESVYAVADHIFNRDWSQTELMSNAARLLSLPETARVAEGPSAAEIQGLLHTEETDMQAALYHYDLSNDFYKLFLDRYMLYTCAYFGTPEDSIDTAQERKLEYLCRKLRLRPGERVMDIGCGWGGFMLYAAQHYGVEVVGISLSQEQTKLARERIEEAGLEHLCRIDICDYRDVKDYGRYDKLVSVGMFEQVGEALLSMYFKQAYELLRPGGVFLNHAISMHSLAPVAPEPTFIHRYVFPSGELVPVHMVLSAAEMSGFEVRDVESLREHYVYTLRHWVRLLEEHAEEVRRITDEVTYRIWRLYMSSSIHQFKSGNIGIHQTLLVKPDGGRSGMPLTREDWYR
jgi:cyclopropane-fatty-acyl-phospholipid synthase